MRETAKKFVFIKSAEHRLSHHRNNVHGAFKFFGLSVILAVHNVHASTAAALCAPPHAHTHSIYGKCYSNRKSWSDFAWPFEAHLKPLINPKCTSMSRRVHYFVIDAVDGSGAWHEIWWRSAKVPFNTVFYYEFVSVSDNARHNTID